MNEIRIYPRPRPIEPAIIARFGAIAAANVADAMGRKGAAVGVRPIGGSLSALNGRSIAGPALTVLTRPGDNLAVHKALDLAEPGDIVVVDAQGDLYSSILGELMTRYAKTRGIGALVVDGTVRDWDFISGGGMPVFARGISHVGPTKAGPGDISVAVSLGGTVVHDGDLIVGDRDGITVVPRDQLDVILAAAEEVVADEDETRLAIDSGRWDRSWIDTAATITTVGARESR
jgi:regulator of RNase E activity RraA